MGNISKQQEKQATREIERCKYILYIYTLLEIILIPRESYFHLYSYKKQKSEEKSLSLPCHTQTQIALLSILKTSN